MIQINTPRLHLVLHLLVSAFGRVEEAKMCCLTIILTVKRVQKRRS